MKILIVSDTHGKDSNFEKVVYNEAPFDYLIHCGDVEGRELFIEVLAECPCCIVAGNNDFFCDLPREAEITVAGKKMLVTHGHYYGVSMDYYRVADEARARKCQIALFGHTHRPVVTERDGILVMNPGSLSYPRQEGRRPSYIVVEAEEGEKFDPEIRFL